MPSAVFIKFLERKLMENGVGKLVPDQDVMATHARRILEQRLVKDLLDSYSDEMRERASEAIMPDDLATQVATLLEHQPEMPWDEAVAAIIRHNPEQS